MARKAERREAARLGKRMAWTWTIAMGNSDHCGMVWNISPEGSIVNFVNEDAEEGGSLVTRIRPELGVDLYSERGGDGGKQTGLTS